MRTRCLICGAKMKDGRCTRCRWRDPAAMKAEEPKPEGSDSNADVSE